MKQVIKNVSLKMFEKYSNIYWEFNKELILKIEKDEFNAKISEILSFIPNQEEAKLFLDELQENEEMANQIGGSIIEEKVLDFISKTAVITTKQIQDKEVDQIWYDLNNNPNF